MDKESRLVSKYRSIAENILDKELSPDLVYHNIEHTRSVVRAFGDIGKGSNLSEKELELGTIAAWFHDTGYTKRSFQHEAGSAELFHENVSDGDFSDEEIQIVENLILSTKVPQNPKTTAEKVLCDADLHHLGTSFFFESSELLKKEMENVSGQPMKKERWFTDSYYFVRDHEFLTEYGKKHYNEKKEENLAELRSSIKEFKKQDKEINKLELQLEKLNAKLDQKPSRGIETMFRITSRNHLQLSSMADSKANIMISINTIVISVVLSTSVGKIAEYPNLLLPTVVLVLVCLATIVLAVLATRPTISSGTFKREDIMNKKTNLLFFGNFHGMDIDDYQWGVNEMMKDADYLYSSLTRDIFFLGKVLGRKYKILRTAYTTFMVGFVVSILLYIITAFLDQVPLI